MNETEKLLRKVSKQDRDVLLRVIDSLDDKSKRDALNPIRLKNSDVYRIRKGNFRILYHIEKGKAIVDAVRYRNEKTYRS